MATSQQSVSSPWILIYSVYSFRLIFFCLPRRMSINEGCEAEKITSMVNQHVPKAIVSRQHEAELTFTLPFESMDTFPGQITLYRK